MWGARDRTRPPSKWIVLLGALPVGLALASCGSSSKPAATATSVAGSAATAGASAGATSSCSSQPGISPTSVKVGVLSTSTGPLAATTGSFPNGVAARVKVANAAGGVDGRQIVLSNTDNASNPSQALPAAQTLVQQDNAFLVINGAPEAAPMYPYLLSSKIPLLEPYGEDPQTVTDSNTFTALGNNDPKVSTTTDAVFFKSEGVTKLAVLAVNDPGSTASANAQIAIFQQMGIPTVYKNYSLTQSSFDATSDALAIKSSGANGLFMPTANTPFISVFTALQQQHVNMKVAYGATVYDTNVLKAGNLVGAWSSVNTVPYIGAVSSLTPAAQQFRQAMQMYESSAPLNFFALDGYLSGDLLVQALKAAGPCPTRQDFISKLRQGSYNSPLLASPTSYTPGADPTGSVEGQCSYFVQVQQNSFSVTPKPVCGSTAKAG